MLFSSCHVKNIYCQPDLSLFIFTLLLTKVMPVWFLRCEVTLFFSFHTNTITFGRKPLCAAHLRAGSSALSPWKSICINYLKYSAWIFVSSLPFIYPIIYINMDTWRFILWCKLQSNAINFLAQIISALAIGSSFS